MPATKADGRTASRTARFRPEDRRDWPRASPATAGPLGQPSSEREVKGRTGLPSVTTRKRCSSAVTPHRQIRSDGGQLMLTAEALVREVPCATRRRGP